MLDIKATTIRTTLRALLAATLVASATAVHSAPRLAGLLDALPQVSGSQGNLARPGQASAPSITPAQAAERARKKHGGKVLSVDLERGGLSPQYRIKIIDNGNVRVVREPAN